jgi:HEAT repeat protein
MKKSKSRVVLSILAVLLGGLALFIFQDSRSQDESLDGRLTQLVSWRATSRRNAAAALARFSADSEKVVPALLAALRDSDPEVRRNALETLASFGEKAEGAGPVVRNLVEKDRDQEVRRCAAAALGAFRDKEAVSILVKTLEDPNPMLRIEAVRSLGRFGKEAWSQTTVDTLLSFLAADRPTDLREASLDALAGCAKDDERVARTIAAVAAKDPSFQVRKKAVAMLVPEFDFSIPSVIAALDDPSPEVQLTAGSKLAWIGLADDRTVPALCHAALTAQMETREGVGMNIDVLVVDRHDDKTLPEQETRRFQAAVAEFRKVLETPDAAAREVVVRVLGRLIGTYEKTRKASLLEPARAAVDALVARMKDEKEDLALRIHAANQWEVIQFAVQHWQPSGSGGSAGEDELHAATSWIQALGRLIKSPYQSVSSRALTILSDSLRYQGTESSFRAAWRDLALTIAEVAKNEDQELRGPTLKLLAALGPEATGALATLRSLAQAAKDRAARSEIERTIHAINSLEDLTAKGPETRAAAAAALGQVGWRATTALPKLIALLQDPEAKVRAAAANALAGLGGLASSATTPLAGMVTSDPDSAVRLAALAALEAIGPGSPTAIMARLKALHDSDSNVRKTAAVFPRAASGAAVVQALTAALADPSDEVALTAATSLTHRLFERPEALTALITALADPRQRKIVLPAIDSHLDENNAGQDFRRFRSRSKDLQITVAPAIPMLRDALALKDDEVTIRVYRLLGRILESARLIPDAEYRESLSPAVDLYLKCLEQADADVRQKMVGILDEVPVRRVAIVTALLAHLKRPELPAEDRTAVLRALAAQASAVDSEADLKQALEPVIPILIETLETSDLDLKLAAIRALGCIASDARSAKPALERLAKYDPRPIVRTLAESAIKAINGTAKMPAAPPPSRLGGATI